uniref:Reticulocalbin-1 n=1 Tax=Schmidtea mediterranea TaxID=79327 RepID=E5G9H8_SCHMD|nr:reticulocalbin-1 [Schmidtea mediterranea]
MNPKCFILSLMLFVMFIAQIKCSDPDHDTDQDHHESESVEHGDDFHHDDPSHGDDYEPHEFDYDPHQTDSDYDEDLVTGTSHHAKRTKEQTKTEIDEIFKKVDKNNDTKIDRDELTLYIIDNMKKLHTEITSDEFKEVDKNSDQKVSLDEYFLHKHQKTSEALENLTRSANSSKTQDFAKKIQHERERFKAADSDSDGFLNVHEYLLMLYPVFYPHMAHTIVHEYIEDFDTNNDGLVGKDEYIKHFLDIAADKKILEEEVKKKREAEFDKYDKDKNGKIDPEEYYAILKPGYENPAKEEVDHLFKETDTNKDGIITLDEVESHAHLWLGGEPLDEDSEYSHHYDDEL